VQTIALLTPFDTAMKVLSANKAPTLPLVLPTRYKLRRHLTSLDSDTDVVAGLKQQLSHFIVSPLHAAATLLDPRLKGKDDLISQEMKNKGIEVLVQTRLENHITEPSSPAINQSTETEEQPAKRAHLDLSSNTADFFDDLFAPPPVSSSSFSTSDELQTYITSNSEAVGDGDLLQYWKKQQVSFPSTL